LYLKFESFFTNGKYVYKVQRSVYYINKVISDCKTRYNQVRVIGGKKLCYVQSSYKTPHLQPDLDFCRVATNLMQRSNFALVMSAWVRLPSDATAVQVHPLPEREENGSGGAIGAEEETRSRSCCGQRSSAWSRHCCLFSPCSI
jgi:hypothetical protein